MWLLRETLSYFILRSHQEPISSWSHSRAIMALDHSRLGLENKFQGNKLGRIFFCVRQVYFTNSCQQIWGCVNQPFILFIHHIGGKTELFIIQTSGRMRYFTIYEDKFHSVNVQDDQSWAFSETVQKIHILQDVFFLFAVRKYIWRPFKVL